MKKLYIWPILRFVLANQSQNLCSLPNIIGSAAGAFALVAIIGAFMYFLSRKKAVKEEEK